MIDVMRTVKRILKYVCSVEDESRSTRNCKRMRMRRDLRIIKRDERWR
jgi:hypothetical protein